MLDPDVAEPVHESLDQARRDAAPRDGGRGASWATTTCARCATSAGRDRLRRGHRLPAQAAQHGARRGGRAGGRARPAASSSTTTCARRRDGVWAAGDVIEVPHGLTMLPIRGLTGSHAYAQGRTAGANAAGDDRAYDPVWVPWGLVARRLHDRRLLDRRDAGRRAMGVPYVLAKGVGVSRARYFPGATRTHVKLLAEPGHAAAHRRPGPRRRGRQGALRLPRLRGQARRDARGPGLDGEHLLAADRRAVRADRDRRAERPGRAARAGARRQAAAAVGAGMSALATSSSGCASSAEHHLRIAAMEDLRRATRRARRRPTGRAAAYFWRLRRSCPLYRRVPWEAKETAMQRAAA